MIMDARFDLEECEVCLKKFKPRGIKIHQAKTRCGEILTADSHRRKHKSEDDHTQESHHSGTDVCEGRKKRLPFIVSQEYHSRRSTKLDIEHEVGVKVKSKSSLPVHMQEVIIPNKQKESVKQLSYYKTRQFYRGELADREPYNDQKYTESNMSPDSKITGVSTGDIGDIFMPEEKIAKGLLTEREEEVKVSKTYKQQSVMSWMKLGKKSSEESEEGHDSIETKIVSPATTELPGRRNILRGKKKKEVTLKNSGLENQSNLRRWFTTTSKKETMDIKQEAEKDCHKPGNVVSSPLKEEQADLWETVDQWSDSQSSILKLTTLQIDELSNKVRRGEDGEILADHNLVITRHDLLSLYNRNYLNDTIVDEYMLLIRQRNLAATAVLSIYFYQRYDLLDFDTAYSQTKSWVKEDLRNKEFIIIPIHKSDHYSLICVDIGASIIHYFDSIVGGRKTSQAPRVMKRFMEKYYEERGERRVFKVRIRWDVPEQLNSVDCGVFVCQYAERFARKASFNFQQSDMAAMRWKMTWEILNGSLKEFLYVIDAELDGTNRVMEVKKKGRKNEGIIQEALQGEKQDVEVKKICRKSVKKKTIKETENTPHANEGKLLVENREKPANKSKADNKSTTSEDQEERNERIKWPLVRSGEWEKLDTDLTMMLKDIG